MNAMRPYRAVAQLGNPEFPHTATEIRVSAADREGHTAKLFGYMATVVVSTGCMSAQTYASPAALRELARVLLAAADVAEQQAFAEAA